MKIKVGTTRHITLVLERTIEIHLAQARLIPNLRGWISASLFDTTPVPKKTLVSSFSSAPRIAPCLLPMPTSHKIIIRFRVSKNCCLMKYAWNAKMMMKTLVNMYDHLMEWSLTSSRRLLSKPLISRNQLYVLELFQYQPK